MKPGAPPLQSARLLDQVRKRVRYMHYSLKTEKACLYWARFFVRWSASQPGGMRLRVKDMDFDRHAIVVREAKGNKDRG